MIESMLQVLFWTSALLMLHSYVLYPLSLRLFVRKYDLDPTELPDAELPTIAMMVAAYNEERVIGRKIENSLALDYPADKFEILVGSDGSTDQTDRIVQSYNDPRVKLVRLGGRNGKPLVLNGLVETTRADIVSISDADVILEPQVMRLLARHFKDPTVGVASASRYVLPDPSAELSDEERRYAVYTNAIKARESMVGGGSGGLGLCLAVRRSIYQPFAPGSANDDTTPMLWATLAGMRTVWDVRARAFEYAGQSFGQEFKRRVRIGAGNFQTLFRYLSILHPRHGVTAYTYGSHKVIRWVFPFLMLLALVANVFLRDIDPYRTLLYVQGVFYAIAALGALLVAFRIKLPPVTSLFHFVAMNAALFLGFFRYLKQGDRKFVWEPTART